MPDFNSAKWLAMLTVIAVLMNSCVSSQKVTAKKRIPEKRAITPATEITEEEASVIEIPSYPENVAFSEATGFNEYVIGSGDVLTITEWKTTGALDHTLTVRPDGKVSFSFFEDIKAAGLTPTQIDDLITSQLEGFVKKPRIDVFVKEYKSKKVSFLGEINRRGGIIASGPGIYPLKGKTKLTELLLEAGSETEKADLKNVTLIRRGRLYKLNLLSAMRLKDLSQDVLIENGDKITIPLLPQFKKEKESVKHAYVFGQVQRPGSRIFSGNATVADVLSQSQGIIMARANLKHVNVIRGTPDNPVFIKLNYYNFLNNGDTKQNIRIKDGDVIFVPRKGLVKTQDTVAQIGSILNVVLAHPASFREKYTTGGGLRMDTDVSEKSLREEDRLGGFAGSNP
jgi:polysaccharide export outer membrane protein